MQAVDARIVSHVAEFLEKHPNIELKLSLSDNIVDIVEMGFDLAIRVGSLTSSTLLARKLAENPRILVASPEYLKKHSVPQLPQDLSAHKCVVLGETKVWHLGDKSGLIEDIKVSGPFTTNLGDAVTETIIDGLGIGMKSIWDVREQVAKGELEPKYYNLKTYVGFAMNAPPSVSAKAKVRLEPNVTDAAPRTNGRSAANFLALPTQRF